MGDDGVSSGTIPDGGVDTAPRPAPRIGLMTAQTGLGPVQVTAERTECPQLLIVPVFDPLEGLTGDWQLGHEPTGRYVTGTAGLDPRELRDMARLLADMPIWASENLALFRQEWDELHARVTEARDRVTA